MNVFSNNYTKYTEVIEQPRHSRTNMKENPVLDLATTGLFDILPSNQ